MKLLKCFIVQRCSRKCQKAHWKVHKKHCNASGRVIASVPSATHATGEAATPTLDENNDAIEEWREKFMVIPAPDELARKKSLYVLPDKKGTPKLAPLIIPGCNGLILTLPKPGVCPC